MALPIVAGPILFITYLEHGRRFVARAASASLLGLVSLALFALVFVLMSRTHAWTSTLVIGWLVCLVTDLGLSVVHVPPLAGLCFVMAAIGITTKIMPTQGVRGDQPAVTFPWWDLPARAAATGALVFALTTTAAQLGPGLTGMLAPFPTGISIVATFTLAQGGSSAATATMSGVIRGLWGFTTFCFLVSVLVEPLGGAIAFVIATTGAPGVQLALRRAPRQRESWRPVLRRHRRG